MEQCQLSLALTTDGLFAVVGSKPQLSYYSFYAELSDDSYSTMVNDTFALFSNVSVIGEAKKVINSYKVDVSAHYVRLDYDGHLRAYGYDDLGWFLMVGDALFLHACEYPIPCGPYGICSNRQCTCPLPRGEVSDFNPVSYRKPELGCSRNVPLTCEDSHKHWSSVDSRTFDCLKDHLKNTTMQGDIAKPYIVDLIKLLLENVLVLEKTVISSKSPPDDHNTVYDYSTMQNPIAPVSMVEVSQLMSSFRRASTQAEACLA